MSYCNRNEDSSSGCISIQSFILKKTEQKRKKTVLSFCTNIHFTQAEDIAFWLNPHQNKSLTLRVSRRIVPFGTVVAILYSEVL